MRQRAIRILSLVCLPLATWTLVGAVAPPPPPPPVKAQANMMLVDAFPGDADLAATLVTLHATNQRWPDVLKTLDNATGCQHDTRTAGANQNAQVTINLDKAPMMEALFQIMSQGSVRAEPMPVPTPSVFKGNTIQDPYGRPSSPV